MQNFKTKFLAFFRTRIFKSPHHKSADPPFVRTGVCPVCGQPAIVRFTKGKGMPYESCEEHQIKALLILCHNRGYKVLGRR